MLKAFSGVLIDVAGVVLDFTGSFPHIALVLVQE